MVAQLRFPTIASVEKGDYIAAFQEAVRGDYPVLRSDEQRGVVFGPTGIQETRSNRTWRFLDRTGTWTVTLAPDFLAIDTAKYVSRDDFLNRLQHVTRALRDHIGPASIDRVGVRYIDRVVGENLADLPQLVRPEVAGVLATPFADRIRHALVEHVFRLSNDTEALMARWARLPAHATVDPGAVEAIDEDSWVLDLDAFAADSMPLDVDAIVERTRAFAERIYTFFRWAVTDEFLRRYGGHP